jgi:ECF sigma factor
VDAITRVLNAIEHGDPHAAEQLLPLVYDELRRLAAAKLAQEKPGQTLDATALVHEAYLRLGGGGHAGHFAGHGRTMVDICQGLALRGIIRRAVRGFPRRFRISEGHNLRSLRSAEP